MGAPNKFDKYVQHVQYGGGLTDFAWLPNVLQIDMSGAYHLDVAKHAHFLISALNRYAYKMGEISDKLKDVPISLYDNHWDSW